MSARIWRGLACAGIAILTLAGCDLPVRVGIKEARAAGVAVDAMPAPRLVSTANAQPAAAPPISGAAVHLPTVAQPTAPDDVVGVKIEATGDLRRRSVTFGQVFEAGAVPAGRTVTARAGGARLPTQMDVKTTYPDGSARMGIVSVTVDGTTDAMLVRTAPDGARPAVDLGGLAGQYDMTVELAVSGGERHRFDLGSLLAQALKDGRVSYWLRGPIATEGRIAVPVTGSLRLVADIRAYADGSVMTDVQLNNDLAMQPAGGALVYDVAIRSKGRTLLQKAGLRHFQYQTWHLEAWSNGAPPANVVHDVPALARAGAIQNYDTSTGVAAALLQQQAQSMTGAGFDILGNAGLAQYMGMTGGRPDIGATTLANTAWLVTQHPAAARYALAQADAAGSIPWHFFEQQGGTYVTATKYPKLWSDGRGGQWDTKGFTQPVDHEHSGWAPDNAHQPDLSYVPYILTGLRYRYDQLEAQAAAAIIAIWPTSRQDDRALVVSHVEQVRGRAWALRAIDAVVFIAPDSAPMRPYFQRVLRNNIDFMLADTRTYSKGEAYGWVPDTDGAGTGGGATAPWMQDFLASTLILSATRKVDGAREVVEWMSHYLAGRFLAADRGFRPNNATAYRMIVFQASPEAPFMTWRDVEAATIRNGFAKDSRDWSNDDRAYVQAARGVLAGMVSVTGSRDAERAYAWLNANGPGLSQGDYMANPTWNIVPMASRRGR